MLLLVLTAVVLGTLLFWALAFSSYVVVLIISGRRATKLAPPHAPFKRLLVLVPAHNEELLLGECIKSLQSLKYPAEYFTILVVADNCSDRTAPIARAAGVQVLERSNLQEMGKGYALAFGIENALPNSEYDGVVVIDADTVVSPNLLSVFNDRLCAGASAIQARHSIRNWDVNWFTRLAEARFVLFNHAMSAGRANLRLSADLAGNGMCFSKTLLGHVPWEAYSITEDVEYARRLLLRGYIVEYAPDARVFSDTPTHPKAARGQRRRCEVGRWHVFRSFLVPLLRPPVSRRNVAAALDLAVPSFTAFLSLVLVGVALTVCSITILPENVWRSLMTLWFISLLLISGAVTSALLRECPARVTLSLARVPWYLVWKNIMLVTSGVRRGATPWARADRERPDSGIS